ncbi:MAG: tetratricopeptide repeat protein, partial [Bacteroidota bacterium]
MNQPTKSVSLPLIVLTIVFMSHFRLNAQDRINQEKAGSLHYEQGMEALRSGENLKATVKYFEKAAAEGNANAQYIVGRYLLNANHSPSTEKEAYDLLLESAKKGQMDALSEVSKHFDSFSIDSRNSINSKLKELSGNGDLKASSLLAQAYLNGTMGYSKDPQKALSLLEKTVVLQDSQDEYLLGALYLTGQGGKRDYLKAEALFSKGLKKAYAPSIFSLGYQHFRGLGVVQDYKKAKAYFQKSATLGYADAHALLASLYYYGLGVTEDLESALMELEKGVEKGSDQARSILEEINKKEPRSFSELD